MIAVSIYFAAIVAANLSIAHFGPWVSPINSFLLVGLDLSLRDLLHDRWRGAGLWPRMLGLIIGAGAVSYLLNPAAGQIAVASAVAFTAAGIVNAIVYQRAIRLPFLARSNASNVPAAATDSLIFPTLAFGALMPEIVALQFVAKVGGGAVWSLVIAQLRRARQVTATSHLRGHPIEWDALRQQWVYRDTHEPTAETWRERTCGHCGEHETPEGHDACLGTLPEVMNACCGHGDEAEAYVQYPGGHATRGREALEEIDRLMSRRDS